MSYKNWKIESVIITKSDCYNSDIPFKITVTLKIDSKLWFKLRDKKELGWLYNRDVSNALYDMGYTKYHGTPVVNDSKRSEKGIKTVKIYYYIDAPTAKAYGVEFSVFKPNCYVAKNYNTHKTLFKALSIYS